ncbi:putative Ig domain-containing protein, partial [Aquirufa salirivi]
TVTGTVTSYSISTPLPTGLLFNTTTGVISGNPSVTSPATDYTVTATNVTGSTTAVVRITVNAAAPSALSYTTP